MSIRGSIVVLQPLLNLRVIMLEAVFSNLGMLVTGFGLSLLIFSSGVGAGVVVIPILVVGFELSPASAVATGAAYSFFSKILMTAGHAKAGHVDWPMGLRFLRVCLPVTIIFATLISYFESSIYKPQLDMALTYLIIFAGCFSILSLSCNCVLEYVGRVSLGYLSAFTGVVMGLTGVGGGILVVPALSAVGGLDIKRAIATSIPIGLVLSGAVSATLGVSGLLDYAAVFWLMVGTVFALPLAKYLFSYVSEQFIKRLTLTMIALSLLGLLIKSFSN